MPTEDDYVTLLDGTLVRCRQDSSTMWIIYAPASLNPQRKGANMVGTEKPTRAESTRCSAALHATYGKFYNYTHLNITYEPRTAGVPHPEGWYATDQSYRNEADEAAVIARWRERTGR